MTDSAAIEETQSSMPVWQRVSPIAIIFFIIKFAVRFVKEGALNFAPAIAVFITQVDDKWFWFGIVLSALFTFIVIYSILYFRKFRFLIESNQITLELGVLKQEKTILNFAKIQNVNLSTPFYFAPFQLVNCIFDSAGSSQKEISFPGIKREFAEQIRTDVMSYRRTVAKNEVSDATGSEAISLDSDAMAVSLDSNNDQDASNEKLQLNVKDLAIFGLSSNRTFLALAVLAPFSNHIVEYSKASLVPGLLTTLEGLFVTTQSAKIAAVIIIVSTLFLAAVSLSVISSIVQFYGYRFFDEGKNLRRIAGLLDSHQISLSKHRVQAITIRQNFVMKLFKRVTVQFNQLAAGASGDTKGKNNLSIPSLKQELWPTFVSDCFADLEVNNLNFLSISSRFISRVFIFFWLLPISIASMLLMQLHFNWVWLLAVLPVGLGFTLLRYKRFGLWFNDEYVAIRSGMIGTKISVLPMYKIQHISMSQSPMMRRKLLANVSMQLPFGERTIPYLPKSTAQALINLASYKVESSTKKWL